MRNMLLPKHVSFDGAFPRLSRRLRLGVVGGGRISLTQSMAARMSDRWEVVAAALSSNPQKAKQQAGKWFLPEERCYPSYQQMAEQEAERTDGIDAVMITTPNDVHYSAARTFLQAGIDVLCDKPLTNEVSHAQDLIELTKKSARVFAVGYVMSAYPMIRQARALVQSGSLGAINQIHVEFMQDWMVPDGIEQAEHVQWRLDPARSGETSCTGDIATHAAHLASFVSAMELTHVSANMHVCGAPKELEDTVMMMTRYNSAIPGTLVATRLATGNRAGLRLRIFGSDAGLEWDQEYPDQLRLNRYGQPDQIFSRGHGHGIAPEVERLVRTGRGFPEGIIEAWANLYTEFALAVACRQDAREYPDNWLNYPTVEQGAQGVGFIHAVVASHNNGGKWVATHTF